MATDRLATVRHRPCPDRGITARLGTVVHSPHAW